VQHSHGRCVGGETFVNYYDPELFRTMVKACCRVESLYSIVNFGRKELNQTGSGHFACLGGYHPKSDKVLLMDTARFKYPPFWVQMDELYDSLQSLDKDSGKMRGFLVLSKKEPEGSSLIKRLPTNTPKVRFMSDLTLD
jgi:glutathione gamma-glutamylcysteinyltransferase